MVSFELRLPPGQWRRLVTLADDTNLPIQALILAALQAEMDRRDPE